MPPGHVLGFGAATRYPPPATGPASTARSDASLLTKVIAFLVCAVAFAALTIASSETRFLSYCVLALACGAAMSQAVDLRRFFRSFPGAAAALIAFLVLIIAWAVFVESRVRNSDTYWVVIVISVAIVGLDWYWSERLRAMVVLSGFVFVGAVSAKEVAALPLAVVWFLGVLAMLWSVERDARTSGPRLAPMPGQPPEALDAPDSRLDLVRIASIAGVAALSLAFVIGTPSCSPNQKAPSASGQGAGSSNGGPSQGGYGGAGGAAGGAGGGYGGSGGGYGASGGASGGGYTESDGGSDGGYSGSGSGSRSGSGSDSGSGSGSGSGGNGGVVSGGANGGGVASGAVAPGAAKKSADLGPAMLAVLVVLLLVLAVTLLWPYLTRRTERAEEAKEMGWSPELAKLAETLEREGAKRGRPRRRHETIRDFAAALADSVLPDPRLVEVGNTLSASLFGPHPLPADASVWMRSVLDEAMAAHPAPSRIERWQGARAEPSPVPVGSSL
jgi:hypothetical protein